MNKDYVNKDIKPSEDFYGFAAGNWSVYNKQPDDEPSWGNFDVLEETVTKRLRDIIDTLDDDDPMQQKMNSYMRVYTNYKRRNDEGIRPLLPYIEKLRMMTSKEELLEWYTKTFMSDLFCNISLFQDLKDSTRFEVFIEQSLDLGNRDYYISTTQDNIDVRKKYREVMTDILKIAGYTDDRAEELFKTYFTLETDIAKLAYPQEKLEKPEENYNRYSIDELSALIGMDARKLLSWSGFTETEMVVVAQPEPVKRAFELIGMMTLPTLKTVIEYSIVTDFCGKCSENFTEKAWEFEQYMTGAKERSPKWKREVNHINDVFYEPLGQIYSERYFNHDAKRKIMELVRNIKDSFREIISEQKWMTYETRQKALEKMDTMTYKKIGFPDKWEDYSNIPVDESKSFLENRLEINRWSHARYLKKYYNKPYDPTEWPMMPQTVNACCMQLQNEICFPAAILQTPFFSPDADDASNYGAIGVVIGHEMTHNFDMAGRLFTKDGNMEDWWSKEDVEKFKELTVNTKARFDSMDALPFIKCNGELTLNENIADFGGLKIAYRALEKIMKNRKDIDSEWSWRQRFFISYAQMWANVATDEIIKRQVMNNCHSIPKIRTNGTLPMFDPWYDVWNIDESSPLFVPKEKRARIW